MVSVVSTIVVSGSVLVASIITNTKSLLPVRHSYTRCELYYGKVICQCAYNWSCSLFT